MVPKLRNRLRHAILRALAPDSRVLVAIAPRASITATSTFEPLRHERSCAAAEEADGLVALLSIVSGQSH
jgi:hypothetical protein